MIWLAVMLLLVALAVGWLAQLVALPGSWLIVVAAGLYAWWIAPGSPLAIGWPTVIALLILAALGELIELAAGAWGVTKLGGSRRGALLALVGSLIGGLLGVFVGLPIPLVGSLAAAVLFAGLGALAGAFLGERWKGRDFDSSLQIGQAAFRGRVLGTLIKVIICTIMVAVALVALVF